MARYKDGNSPEHRREKVPEEKTVTKKRKLRCLACNNGKTLLGTCTGCKGKGYIQ